MKIKTVIRTLENLVHEFGGNCKYNKTCKEGEVLLIDWNLGKKVLFDDDYTKIKKTLESNRINLQYIKCHDTIILAMACWID